MSERIPLWAAYLFTAGGFLAIYLGLGGLTSWLVRRVLPARQMGAPIRFAGERDGQRRVELKMSLSSVALFGLFGAGVVALDRTPWVQVDWQPSALRAIPELAFLVLWNDLHFYLCHRLMHTPWLYRRVHIVHHRSVAPTPYATYCFHWAEALLLGSVILWVLPFHDFNIVSLMVFPVVSLLFNNLGHMNYDLAPQRPNWHPLAASRRHARHHSKVRGNYGFLLPTCDWLFGTRIE